MSCEKILIKKLKRKIYDPLKINLIKKFHYAKVNESGGFKFDIFCFSTRHRKKSIFTLEKVMRSMKSYCKIFSFHCLMKNAK